MSDQVEPRLHINVEDLLPGSFYLTDLFEEAIFNPYDGFCTKDENTDDVVDRICSQLRDGELALMIVGDYEFRQGKPEATFQEKKTRTN